MTREDFLKRYNYNNRTDKIGGGSFGTVYKAYDRVLDRYVAIKVSEVKQIQNKEVSLQIEFEAIKPLAKHPNIANYESVHRFEDGPGIFDYAIMQYYPLGNLSSFIKKHDLDENQKGNILVQILEGLAYLHDKKVVHRDIKPGNILVVERPGEGIVPKITDFGLSKLAEVQGDNNEFANSFAGGTVQYSSPEQLKGLPLKFNTDLWSFGVIVHEVFMGYSLFDVSGHSSASVEWQSEIMKQILHKDLNNELKNLPNTWSQIADDCLQRDTSQRISSGKELLNQVPKNLYQKQNNTYSTFTAPENHYEQDDDAGTVLVDTSAPKKPIDQTAIQSKDKVHPTTAAPTKRANKKILLSVLIVVLVLSGAAFVFLGKSDSSTLARVELNGKSGYVNAKGKEIISPIYINGFGFSNGFAPVQKNGKWIFIDESQNVIFKSEFDFAAPFSENLAVVRIGNKWGYIDLKGEFIIEPRFDLAGSFSNGFATIQVGDKWGYIDLKGKIFIKPQFDAALEFSEGLGAIKRVNKWGYINSLGSIVIDYEYDMAQPYSNGLAAVSQGNRHFFVDKKGNKAFETEYARLGNFSEGLAPVMLSDKWGYIDKTGKTIIPSAYDGAGIFVNGLAPVKKNQKWGFINKKGELLINFIYDYADNFSKLTIKQ